MFLQRTQVVLVKNSPANAGDLRDAGLTLGGEDPLEEGMATHSSVLAWRISILVAYNPWGRKESETTEATSHACMFLQDIEGGPKPLTASQLLLKFSCSSFLLLLSTWELCFHLHHQVPPFSSLAVLHRNVYSFFLTDPVSPVVGSLHSHSDVETHQIVPFLFIQWVSERGLSWEREEEIHEFSYINVFITCILCCWSQIQSIFGYSEYLWILSLWKLKVF